MKYSVWREQSDAFISPQTGIAQLVDLLCSYGEHPDIVLRKTKLFKSDLCNWNMRISPKQAAQLYFNITLTEHFQELPLNIGARVLPSALGELSPGLTCASTLEEAMNYLIASTSHWSPLVTINRKYSNGEYYYYFTDAYGVLQDGPLRLFVYLLSMEAIRATIIWLSEPDTVIQWKYELGNCDTQTQMEVYAKWGEKVQFGQPFFCLSIPESELSHPLNTPSPTIFNSAFDYISKEREKNSSIIDLINKEIAKDIKDIPSLENIANIFGVSQATLKRKLKQNKTSYQKIIDETRALETFFLSAKEKMKDTEVAEYLNFYDASNLRRAKKRWLLV